LLCDGRHDGSQRPNAANRNPEAIPIQSKKVRNFAHLTWVNLG